MRTSVISADDYRRLKTTIRHVRNFRRWSAYPNALERELRRARLVSACCVSRDLVTMNSLVRVWDADAAQPAVVSIGYSHHGAAGKHVLSVLTPLGTALLGRRVGDVVTCRAAGELRRMIVREILYQPEAAGDLHL
jgi:regulator of nucleoside diphosphate kinase